MVPVCFTVKHRVLPVSRIYDNFRSIYRNLRWRQPKRYEKGRNLLPKRIILPPIDTLSFLKNVDNSLKTG